MISNDNHELLNLKLLFTSLCEGWSVVALAHWSSKSAVSCVVICLLSCANFIILSHSLSLYLIVLSLLLLKVAYFCVNGVLLLDRSNCVWSSIGTVLNEISKTIVMFLTILLASWLRFCALLQTIAVLRSDDIDTFIFEQQFHLLHAWSQNRTASTNHSSVAQNLRILILYCRCRNCAGLLTFCLTSPKKEKLSYAGLLTRVYSLIWKIKFKKPTLSGYVYILLRTFSYNCTVITLYSVLAETTPTRGGTRLRLICSVPKMPQFENWIFAFPGPAIEGYCPHIR